MLYDTSVRFVRMKGLEPPRLAPPDPKSGVATNYTTSAVLNSDNRADSDGVSHCHGNLSYAKIVYFSFRCKSGVFYIAIFGVNCPSYAFVALTGRDDLRFGP